jgi:hypothetical protein
VSVDTVNGLLKSTVRWTAESSEVHNYNPSSAPTYSTHKPHTFILMMEAVLTSEPSQHIHRTWHRNAKEQDQLFSCFRISTRVQAQGVHNIAASCSTVTATYHCNQHTNFQTPQHHKQFTIQAVRTDSLHFPCTHSNKLLSLQSLYSAELTTSHQHTSGDGLSTFPTLSAPRYCIFCTQF